MRKLSLFLLILSAVSLFFNCPSAPPPAVPTPSPTEVPTPTPTVEPSPTPGPTPVVNAVTDEEIMAVKNAIARAEELKAGQFAKSDLDNAKADLEAALNIKDTDPDAARKKLASGKSAADKAYEAASSELINRYAARYKIENDKLLKIEADKFMPDEYNALVNEANEAKELYNKKQIVDAITKGDDTLTRMAELYTKLDSRLKWVATARRDTERNLETAEKNEAYVWVPEKLDKVNEYYFMGINAMADKKIANAEEYFGFSKELSTDLIVAAVNARKKKQTENLKNEVLNLLEESSKLNVATEEGDIIKADPIDINKFLKSIEDEPKKEGNVSPPQGFLNLKAGEVVIMGDVASDNLMLQAKELIKQGIIAEKNGNLDEATEYYTQARNYLNLYKSQSINKLYTVRLIPERRDCLWRIAEYDFIYGNPYLWPLIWRRNRKLIQNPSLIEPGWQLIIPEQ